MSLHRPWIYPRSDAEGRPVRRRLHALSARAGAGARGLPAHRRAARARARSRVAMRTLAPSAIETLQHNHELVHDEEIWIAFTEQIVLGMGGDPGAARACATEMVREWERHENFSLYEDALPVLDELRRHEIKIGLISNGQRDLDEFVGAPRARRRRRRRLEGARPRQAARVDLRRGTACARCAAGGDGDGRGLLRGRHRGRARARDPGDPARPRRRACRTPRIASTRCSRCRRR